MRKTLLAILIFLFSYSIASAADFEFVTGDEDSLIARPDNIFVPESELKINITRPTLNHYSYRIIAMDYVMTIKDPHDNIVFVDIIKDRSRSYDSESNVLFTKRIPADWIDGKYSIRIYTYDRVDYSEVNKLNKIGVDVYDDDAAIDELSLFYNNPSDGILEDLEVLKSRSYASVEKFKMEFFVDETNNPCKIQNVSLSSSLIAEDSYVILYADVENTIPHPTISSFSISLNGVVIDALNVSLKSGEVKTISYEVINPPIGENTVMIEDKSANFEVSGIPLGAIKLAYLDIFTTDNYVCGWKPFNISVVVINTGDKGTESVFIRVNETEISKEIELDYGEKKTVEFEVTLNEPGTYKIEVIGTDMSKIIFVQKSEKADEDDDKDDGLLYFGAVSLIIILFISILIIRKYHSAKEVPELPSRAEFQSLVGIGS